LKDLIAYLPNPFIRISCCDRTVDFAHRANSSYIKMKQDPKLGRQVVEVENVCWLSVTYTWDQVEVGRWEVALRLKVLPSLRWPHRQGEMSRWSVKFPGLRGEKEVEVKVEGEFMKMLQVSCPAPENRLCRGLRVESQHDEGWVKISLPEFTVETPGPVTLQFLDKECPFWKGGIVFDWMELKKVG